VTLPSCYSTCQQTPTRIAAASNLAQKWAAVNG